MMLTRKQLRSTVVDALREGEATLALWEGGSEAFDRADDISDVDFGAIAHPGRVEDVFAEVEAAIAPLEVINRYRVPEPAWHGHSQCFYQFAGAHEGVFLDILVQDGPADLTFIQPERHGASVIHLDPDGVLVPEPFDAAAHAARMRADLESQLARFGLLQAIVRKAIERGQLLDAVGFHNNFTVTPLVTLLGMVHRPHQYDFGMRYLYEVLSPDDAARLERIVTFSDLDELARAHADAVRWFQDLAAELQG